MDICCVQVYMYCSSVFSIGISYFYCMSCIFYYLITPNFCVSLSNAKHPAPWSTWLFLNVNKMPIGELVDCLCELGIQTLQCYNGNKCPTKGKCPTYHVWVTAMSGQVDRNGKEESDKRCAQQKCWKPVPTNLANTHFLTISTSQNFKSWSVATWVCFICSSNPFMIVKTVYFKSPQKNLLLNN